MPPTTLSFPSTVPAPTNPPVEVAGDAAATAAAAAATKEADDDSRAGSMTLLLPQQPSTEKKMEQGLPMPPLPPLQRPRRRLVVKTTRSTGSCNGTAWVLALLAAAAVMAAVAAVAMAMAARAEIFRLKADVDHLRGRLGSHEDLQNYIQVLEHGMAPVSEDDEDIVWEDPQASAREDLSPSYPEAEFEFPADVKGDGAGRHTRRHIPTIGGSYVSSENGWTPEKPEKRLKLYDALTTGTFPPPAVPAVPALPVAPTKNEASLRSGSYHHRSSSGRLGAPSQLVALSATPVDKAVVARRQEDT